MNAVDCVRELRRMGVPVEQAHCAGELVTRWSDGRFLKFTHPRRRKDAGRMLLQCVKRWREARAVA